MIEKDVIFMGQPGVGKGTVAGLISKDSHLKHISTGNIFRDQIAKKTPLGMQVEQIVTTGGYVPDEITNQIVENSLMELQNNNEHFILDGYPRTLEQAKFLSSLSGFNFSVVELVAPEEVILERLSGRRSCSICKKGYHVKFQPPIKEGVCDIDNGELIMRKDDQPEAIKLRLKVYNEQTKPLIDFYKKQGNLIVIEAIDTPENIVKKVLEKLS